MKQLSCRSLQIPLQRDRVHVGIAGLLWGMAKVSFLFFLVFMYVPRF